MVSEQVQHWNFGENLTFKWLLAEISRKHHPVRTLERVSVILFCSAFQNILPTSGLLQLLLWKVRVSSLLKSHMTNNLWSPSSISAVIISVFLPEEAIRWLKGISSIMRGLRFIQLPRLKPTCSSEIKARSCKTQETLRYKLCPRTLYWKKNDWERHIDDFMRKWQPSLQRKIMNLINLAFRRDLLYNPGAGTITQNTWEWLIRKDLFLLFFFSLRSVSYQQWKNFSIPNSWCLGKNKKTSKQKKEHHNVKDNKKPPSLKTEVMIPKV